MNAAIEFKDVDILFPRERGRKGERALQQALARLDAGESREEIAAACGVVVGVAGASLAIEPGEICVMMGLSGSGKSTLMRAANGLNRRDARAGAGQRRERADRRRPLQRRGPATPAARAHRDGVPAIRPAALAHGRRERRLRARDPRRDAGRRRRRTSHDSSSSSASRPGRTATSANSRAACSSASGSRAPSRPNADILLMDEPFSALDPLIRDKLQDELLARAGAREEDDPVREP